MQGSKTFDISFGVFQKAKDDSKFREIYDDSKTVRNKIRTHLRNEYPEEYKRAVMKMTEGLDDDLRDILGDKDFEKVKTLLLLGKTDEAKADYDKIQEADTISILGLTEFAPNNPLQMVLNHADGSSDTITVNHSYNEQQIDWFVAGGALNIIRRSVA